jgi:alpha-galactosidase
MTLTLSIPPEIEQHLDRKAREQGLSTEAYALQLLSESISVQEKSTKLVNLLQSWIDEDDVEEQQETGEYLIQALDEDRLSDRKLFPSELKGVTW